MQATVIESKEQSGAFCLSTYEGHVFVNWTSEKLDLFIAASGRWTVNNTLGWHGPEGLEVNADAHFMAPNEKAGALVAVRKESEKVQLIGERAEIPINPGEAIMIIINDDFSNREDGGNGVFDNDGALSIIFGPGPYPGVGC